MLLFKSYLVNVSSPLNSYPRLTTQALHWERGRPARPLGPARTSTSEVEHLAKPSHLAVLEAGEPPAVPVKSLSGLLAGVNDFDYNTTAASRKIVEVPIRSNV